MNHDHLQGIDVDRTGMLSRLHQLQQAVQRSSLDGLKELGRKIAAGEPVVLGPSKTWTCPHCGFHQPDTEFANGIVWRSDPEVPMTEHINRLHMDEKSAVDAWLSLKQVVDGLEQQLRVLKKKARQKKTVAPVTGRAPRGRRGSTKGKGKRHG